MLWIRDDRFSWGQYMRKTLFFYLVLIFSSQALAEPVYLECTHEQTISDQHFNTKETLKNVNLQRIRDQFDEENGLYHFSTDSPKNRLEPDAVYYQAFDDDHLISNNVTFIAQVKINRLTGKASFVYSWKNLSYAEVGQCKPYEPKF